MMSASLPDRGTSEVPLNRRATIVDVARLAGVAPMTVSRALKGKHVSCDKVNRVMDAVQRLEYRPNELARSLTILRSNKGPQRISADHASGDDAIRKENDMACEECHAPPDLRGLQQQVKRLEEETAMLKLLVTELRLGDPMNNQTQQGA
jgi:hypothetical protein